MIHGGGEKGTELELEFKALIQKNFLDDRLIWAANLTVEPEWEKNRKRCLRASSKASGKRN